MMDSREMSQKDKIEAAALLPREGGKRHQRHRWVRANASLTSILIAFVLLANGAMLVKYNFPWLVSAFSSLSIFGSHAPCSANDAQTSLLGKISSGTWPVQSYKTETFVAPDMAVSKSGTTDTGYLFINPKGNGTSARGPFIMTDENELVWHGGPGDTTNLRVQSLHGKPVITYWNGTSTATFGHGYGSISILDDTYDKVAEVCMKNINLKVPDDVEYPCHLDMHESFLTNHGTVIATAYNVTRYDLSSAGGPKEGWIFDSLFYEIDVMTEEILFSWSSLDHVHDIPLSDSHQPFKSKGHKLGHSQHSPWDYFHINSVQPIDGGYLVNGRHTFAMYKVSHKGDIEWQLQGIHGGDFKLAPGIRFSWQHMPRIVSSTSSTIHLTLYNNDNSEAENGIHETTGLDLSLDLVSKTSTLNRKLKDPADPIYSASQGSYQRLPNNHVLVGYGQIAKVKEYDAAGAVVYTAQFGASIPKLLVASYRAYRQPWRATRGSLAPKITAEAEGEADGSGSGVRTHVYMSWNGATNIDEWTVYAGNSSVLLPRAVTVPKVGFETKVTLTAAFKYVRADAVHVEEAERYAWSTLVVPVRAPE